MKTGEHLTQGKPEDKRKKSLTLIVGQPTDYFPIFGKPSHYMVHHLFKFGNKSVFGTGYAKTERHRGISPRHCAGFLNHRTTQGPYAAWPSAFPHSGYPTFVCYPIDKMPSYIFFCLSAENTCTEITEGPFPQGKHISDKISIPPAHRYSPIFPSIPCRLNVKA